MRRRRLGHAIPTRDLRVGEPDVQPRRPTGRALRAPVADRRRAAPFANSAAPHECCILDHSFKVNRHTYRNVEATGAKRHVGCGCAAATTSRACPSTLNGRPPVQPDPDLGRRRGGDHLFHVQRRGPGPAFDPPPAPPGARVEPARARHRSSTVAGAAARRRAAAAATAVGAAGPTAAATAAARPRHRGTDGALVATAECRAARAAFKTVATPPNAPCYASDSFDARTLALAPTARARRPTTAAPSTGGPHRSPNREACTRTRRRLGRRRALRPDDTSSAVGDLSDAIGPEIRWATGCTSRTARRCRRWRRSQAPSAASSCARQSLRGSTRTTPRRRRHRASTTGCDAYLLRAARNETAPGARMRRRRPHGTRPQRIGDAGIDTDLVDVVAAKVLLRHTAGSGR